MSERSRSALWFGLRFVPLFAISLWCYPKVLHTYEGLVLGGANRCLSAMSPRIVVAHDPQGFVTSRVVRPGGRDEPLPDLPGYRPLNVFAQLPLVLALLLATPMRLGHLVAKGLAGLALIFAIHVAAVTALFSAWFHAQSVPHSSVYDWMGVVATTSGQVGAFAVWGLLTWGFWLSLARPPAGRAPLGRVARRGM